MPHHAARPPYEPVRGLAVAALRRPVKPLISVKVAGDGRAAATFGGVR
ncbi:hypothetical protein [Sinosporangium siamense]|nr:hypothetical protein [Sinosporangium siamense]